MNQPIGNALFQVLMYIYIIENNKLKMFSLMTTGGSDDLIQCCELFVDILLATSQISQ